jgi:NAD(P)-dependent dehydrogenase (short-subunit alcohol dehydrogenase family)
MGIDLAGKRVIISAGASGIGAVMAARFAQAGAQVAVCDIDEAAIAAISSPAIASFKADVGSETEVEAFFDAALDRLGGLDVLVNNAGLSGPTKPVEAITLDEWNETFRVNVTGQFLCVRKAVPVFRAQQGGAIINISSTAGRLGMPLRSVYSATKFSVRGFTDVLAVELGGDNIRVNSILPGMVDGPRLRRVVAEQADTTGTEPLLYLKRMLHNVSMHSMVSQEEVADLAMFLASDMARHISGQSIGVCGNFESYRAPMVVPA